MRRSPLLWCIVGLALLAFAAVLPCHADPAPVFKAFIGANGIWYDAQAFESPGDAEVGVNGRASLSEHLSLVAGTWYGFDNSYVRGAAGVRVTATDVTNPDFSVGLGVQRHFSSEPSLRPEEWAYDATIGWRPWPDTQPKITLGAQGSYGASSKEVSFLVALRYEVFAR